MALSANLETRGADLLRSGSTVPSQLTLSTGTIYPHEGRIIFADRQVDPQTGTIRIVGAFSNPGNMLRPGQFGRIRAMTGFPQGRSFGSAARRDRIAGPLSGRRGGHRTTK